MCSAENYVSISVALASTSKIGLVPTKRILNTCDIGSQCWGIQLLLFICSTMFGFNICHTFFSQFSICSERSGLECLLCAEVMERAWRRWMMLCFNLCLSFHTMTKRNNMRRLCSESEDNLFYDGSLDFLSRLVISGLIMATTSCLCLKLQGIYKLFHMWTCDTGKHAVDLLSDPHLNSL